MLRALQQLDTTLGTPVTLIIGGGGAMILAHHFPLGTTDIDAVPRGIDLLELDFFIKKVAKKLDLNPDWMNPYYATFSHTLPQDYGSRLIEVFSGKNLKGLALGREDLLIMKCFAHRQKDVAHAKALIKKGVDLKKIENHIESLKAKGIPGSKEALDFLDDVMDQL